MPAENLADFLYFSYKLTFSTIRMTETPESVRICLADDHSMIRTALASALSAAGHVIAAQSDGQFIEKNGLAKLLEQSGTEVLIIDINLGSISGLDLIAELQNQKNQDVPALPDLKIIVLTMSANAWQVSHAFELGVMGYVLKGSPMTELLDAIRWVYLGRRFYCRELEALNQNPATKALDALSRREHEVLKLIVQGLSSFEIGSRLYLSPKTVDTYRHRIMTKLDLKGSVELITFAMKNGFLQA